MSKPILHGANLSPYVRKVRVALAEKGIAYDAVPVMPFGERTEYKEISPLGKIPCWQEGDFALPDSSAILAYLERKQPQPALYPSDAREFGRALWFEEYADTKLAAICTVPFFQRVVQGKLMKQAVDEAAIEKALTQEAPPAFDYLEREIGDREFLAGGQFGVADISVASFFVSMAHGDETVDAARWPKLSEYLGRIHGRPAYKAIIEEEKAAIPA